MVIVDQNLFTAVKAAAFNCSDDAPRSCPTICERLE